jgi:N6-adenosine-specific RNA methylase IME4
MTPDDAEEYTQALGQVVAGGWRQIALGQRLGVPKALKLSTDQWVKQRLGGYVKLAASERREAITELKAADPTLSNVAIADVIGVDEKTIRNDLTGSDNSELKRLTPRASGGAASDNSEPAEPLDTMAALATTEAMRQHADIKAKRADREATREDARQANAAKVAHVTDPRELLKHGRFATILIDPPWDFDDEGDVNHFGRGKQDYAAKSLDELLTLPIDVLADTDSHLYLCITNRSLPKGFRLMEAWGFRYVTCLTWVKPSIGMGNYFRGQTEQILFGVKGSQPLKRKDVGTVFTAPRGARHSEKPEELFALVESCSPGPFLEMFQRSKRDGWTWWGEDSQVTDAPDL